MDLEHNNFCLFYIDRFCSCQQLKLLCSKESHCTDANMNNYTYARFHTFREEESRLESSNLHMQTGVKNFLIRLLRVSLWPRSPKMTATGFSQRGTQNASLYYFLATICLCQEDRQIRIYKNILHSIIIQLFVCVILFSVVKCKSRENATKTSK